MFRRCYLSCLVITALLALLAWGSPAPALAQPAKRLPESQAEVRLSFAPLVKEVAPAVVNIYARRVVQERQLVAPLFNDPFFRRFFGDMAPPGQARPRVQNSLGSGVLVSADGLIVTNHHVIAGSDEITVVLNDRREFPASVLTSDERSDLAVLHLAPDAGSFAHLELGDSDLVEVGDMVLAIGNPFGVGQTVTSGIVSALARTNVGINDFGFFIQTDAAVNPGNSGGALVAMDGRMIGVNTAIFSRSGGSHGIGFAIPSNLVRATLESARRGGQLVRPWLGMQGQAVTADIAATIGLSPPRGVLVLNVHRKGPAAAADIQRGDVITEAAGRAVDDPAALKFRLATQTMGSTIPLTVWRRGEVREARLRLEPPPEDPPRQATRLSGNHPLAGATVVNLSPAVIEERSLDGPIEGVLIAAVERGSVADRMGLREGDLVLSVNDKEVARVGDLKGALARAGTPWRVAIRRGERLFSLQVG
jgi:Do/DeqQ family serine protease